MHFAIDGHIYHAYHYNLIDTNDVFNDKLVLQCKRIHDPTEQLIYLLKGVGSIVIYNDRLYGIVPPYDGLDVVDESYLDDMEFIAYRELINPIFKNLVMPLSTFNKFLHLYNK